MVGMSGCQLCTCLEIENNLFTGSDQHTQCKHGIHSNTGSTPKRANLHKTAKIGQVVDEVKQLTDVISDGWTVWIHPLQMLFIHFAHTWMRGVEPREQIQKQFPTVGIKTKWRTAGSKES